MDSRAPAAFNIASTLALQGGIWRLAAIGTKLACDLHVCLELENPKSHLSTSDLYLCVLCIVLSLSTTRLCIMS